MAKPKIQTKKVKVVAESKKPVEKTVKVPRTKQIAKPKVRVSNPKVKQVKTVNSAPTPLKFYTVNEDAQILEALRKADAKTTKSAIAKELAVLLKHSAESVRDRIKRYISKLSVADVKEIQRVSKKSPNHYAYFKGAAGSKKLEKICAELPLIYNRDITRKPRQSKKVKKPSQPRKTDFCWLLGKINATDPYFAIDHSVHLLNSIFAKLMEEHVERKDIESFIHSNQGEVTLFEILNNFVKREQKHVKAK